MTGGDDSTSYRATKPKAAKLTATGNSQVLGLYWTFVHYTRGENSIREAIIVASRDSYSSRPE